MFLSGGRRRPRRERHLTPAGGVSDPALHHHPLSSVKSAFDSPRPASAQTDSREAVVLLHGVALPSLVMTRVAGTLRRAGYRVVNVGYPSRTMPIREIAAQYFPQQLRRHGIESAGRVHFVTHSMGGLVLRLYFQEHRPRNLGRVVMLGPPNHGSAASDYAATHWLFRRIGGINLPALGVGDTSVARSLPAADFALGIIAGTQSFHGLFAHQLHGVNDGAVTVDSARLDGMRDFLTVPHSHTLMLWRAGALAQVLAFLRDGLFARVTPPSISARPAGGVE